MLSFKVGLMATVVAQVALAACSRSHEIETIYSGFNFEHTIKTLAYAIDVSTNDMVVGGKALTSVGLETYLYLLEEESCSLRWH